MLDNPACLLAIEEKPNSFLPFSIQDLGFSYPNSVHTLSEMDLFISIYGEAEIKNILMNANVFPVEALSGDLIILYIDEKNKKRKLPIIPAEYYSNYNLIVLLNENAHDKDFINRIINKINNLKEVDEVRENLKNALSTNDFNLFMQIFGSLSYFLQRNMYLYIVKGLPNELNRTREIKNNEME